MEFWAVEVKHGQPLKVTPEKFKIIHLSQASLGEFKDEKGANKVPLRLKIDDKSFVVGTLSAADRPQMMFDLVIEKGFELSHDWKNGSVFFFGYQTYDPCLSEDDSDDDSTDLDDDLPIDVQENGKPEAKVEKNAPTLKQAEPKSDEDDDSDDEDNDSEDSDESMEDDESDSEEETPVKPAQPIKKRPAAPLPKTNASQKKAKQSTPDIKTGSGFKKASPAKQGGKSPQSFNNSNKGGQKKFNQRRR